MKFPCRWKHGQFFILRFPYWCTTRPRNIFFSPYEQMNEPRLSYLQQGPSLEPMQKETICLKTRSAPFPRYICYINSTVCPVLSGIFNCSIRAFFFPFVFFFFLFFISIYTCVQRAGGIYRRLTMSGPFFLTKFLFHKFQFSFHFSFTHIYLFIKIYL